jgi:hypothetical protein
MPTTVIHIKDAPQGWSKNSDYVYVGRGGRQQKRSLLGNPWAIGNPHPDTGKPIARGEAIELFKERTLPGLLKDHPYAIHALKGKILVCFCGAGRCHGDSLAEAADQTEEYMLSKSYRG